MGRISRACMFMAMARAASLRSTCHRLNVGAIVTHKNSPISVGWNGAAAGAPHCAGNACPGIVPGNCGTLHAEANALNKATKLVELCGEVDLYVTNSPCPTCSLLITQSSVYVRRIFFEIPYRDTSHLSMFASKYPEPEDPTGPTRTTAVYVVTPAGYIVDYFSREVVELP